MLEKIISEFDGYKRGYRWKASVDAACKKNMDSYTGDVVNDTYLPTYSSREHAADYTDRLTRASNGYMNFPEKIVGIYQNAIYRSGQPVRHAGNDAVKRFMRNADGGGTLIGDFVKDMAFIYNQVHGGALIVVDKPTRKDNDTLSKYRQEQTNFFPYGYIYAWPDVVNFGVDRHRALDWIMFVEGGPDNQNQYRYFDKQRWAVIDGDGKLMDQGEHGLQVVPVVRSFNKRNAAHRFLTPKSSIDDVVRLSLKIYEYQSQLEQMIINHAFLKLAMPESMFKIIQEQGMGTKNVFVFPDGSDSKAYYIETSATEIEKMIDLVYNVLPNKILYFATLRDKVAMPREESGVAKFIDSGDEMANLLEKAQSMEDAENGMIRLAALWEKQDPAQSSIVYNKIFDIKSTNEQIKELVDIFKEDLGSPSFNRMMVKRLMMNMLGHVTDDMEAEIDRDLEYTIDPGLNIDDLDKLTTSGILTTLALARKYNPDLRDLDDESVRRAISDNLQNLRGVNTPPELVTG